MKKVFLSLFLLVLALSVQAQVSVVEDQTTAPSPTERNEWLASFESLVVDANLNLKLIKVPETEAPKIIYDNKSYDGLRFRAEVKDRVLYITEKIDARRTELTQVTVYYNTLQSVKLTAVKAVSEGTLDAVQLNLQLLRGASLTAALDVKDLTMELSGASTAKLTGKVRYLSLFASTGKVAASELEVMSAEVNVQSKADVALWITDRFVAKTTTNGRISYKGEPTVVRAGAKFMGGEIVHVQ